MTDDQFRSLAIGDLVRHVTGEHSYVVTGFYGGSATAVRTIDLTNPVEWILVSRANHCGESGHVPPAETKSTSEVA